MSNDLMHQLATLSALRDAATDPAQRAIFDAAIAALEGTRTSHHHQTIGDTAQVAAAVAGDVHGDVQTGGTRYAALIQLFLPATGGTPPDAPDDRRELLVSYLDRLVLRCDWLRLHGVVDWERKRGKAPAFTLSQVYITLAAQEWVTLHVADDAATFAEAQAQGDPDKVLPQDVRVVHSSGAMVRIMDSNTPAVLLVRPRLLTEALSEARHIVLLGGPGSGKSTFLRHLAVALARAGHCDQPPDLPGWSAGLLLPVFASLGGYAAWTRKHNRDVDAESLWDYLLSSSDHDTLDGLREELRWAFRTGNLLLLLDGLDEVADPALRTAVAGATVALAGQQRGSIVVTCRVRSFDATLKRTFADWREPVELAPFTLGQARHFVRGWYGRSVEQAVFSEPEASTRAEQLIAHIVGMEQLRDLAQTPLLLTIITILHYYEGKLPEDRADLYEDMVQLLLTRWTQARREANAPPSLIDQLQVGGLKEYHLRQVLEELAYQAHQSQQSPDGRGLLHRGVVRERLIQLFQDFGLDEDAASVKAGQVLRYLEDESGLLLHEGGNLYALPHLTYEEYLAGCYLVQQDGDEDFRVLADRHWQADATRWREVIFLGLGWMVRNRNQNDAAAWLRFLLEKLGRSADEQQRAALFAAECLAEMGGKAALIGVKILDPAQLWQQMAAALVPVVEGTILPAQDRVQAGVFLGDLGDPRPGVSTLPPEMVRIAGGTFELGDGDKAHPVTVPTFELARYPVTNAQYKLFIDDDGYNPAAPWWAWNTAAHAWLRKDGRVQPPYWADERFGIARPNHPVVGVSWYEAVAFCRWLAQHPQYNPDKYIYLLPSEAEWEYAARRATRRGYPWGEAEPDPERANFKVVYNGTSAVGCFASGATPEEQIYDLVGNVWEWTRSEYRDYPYDPNDGREALDNPAEKDFTLRGGGWFNQSLYLRWSKRGSSAPDDLIIDVGFRLARHRPVKREA